MIEEITEVVKKHVPAAVGEELRKLLEQAKKDAEAVKSLTGRVETLTAQNKEWSSTATILDGRLRDVTAREVDTAKREVAVLAREVRQDLVVERAASAEKRTADIKEIVALVFKSPELRSYMVNVNGSACGVQNAQGYTSSPSLSLSGSAEEQTKK